LRLLGGQSGRLVRRRRSDRPAPRRSSRGSRSPAHTGQPSSKRTTPSPTGSTLAIRNS
jgi:hypothetical protein